MKPMELIAVCQMFLVPASILFGALALTSSAPLRALISLVGLAACGVWLYRLWFWTGLAIIDRNTVLALAGAFAAAYLISLIAQVLVWLRRRTA
jgi:hypothetical protein